MGSGPEIVTEASGSSCFRLASPLARSGHPQQAWQDLPPPQNHILLTYLGDTAVYSSPKSTCWLSSQRGDWWHVTGHVVTSATS